MSLTVSRRRLIAQGDLPGSNGGIYNPGALVTDAGIQLLCRREVDYRFRRELVFPELITLDPATLEVVDHRTLLKTGYPLDTRVEDFRCITFEGQHFAVHTTIDANRIKPELSRVLPDALARADPLDLPIPLDPVEKNWVLFEHDGVLHCLYKLDPLTIFARTANATWHLVKAEGNGWSTDVARTLSNSANLIPFDDGYLGFWHTILDDRYVQGAYLLARDLTLQSRTGILLDGREVTDGYKPGVLYVSALVDQGERLLAFYGEGDAHTGVAVFSREALVRELRQCPFRPVHPLRVRFTGRSLSDTIRAMQAVAAYRERRPRRPIHLLVVEAALGPTVEQLAPPGVVVKMDDAELAPDATISGDAGSLSFETP